MIIISFIFYKIFFPFFDCFQLAWTPFYYLVINLNNLNKLSHIVLSKTIFCNIIILYYFTLTFIFLFYFILFLLYIISLYITITFSKIIFLNPKKYSKIKSLTSLNPFWIWKSKLKCFKQSCRSRVTRGNGGKWSPYIIFAVYSYGPLYTAALHMMRMEAQTSMFHREHSRVWKASPTSPCLPCFSLRHMNANYAHEKDGTKLGHEAAICFSDTSEHDKSSKISLRCFSGSLLLDTSVVSTPRISSTGIDMLLWDKIQWILWRFDHLNNSYF